MTIRRVRAVAAARAARTALAAKRAADLAPIIAEIQASGATTLQAIADGLNHRAIPTTSGHGAWHASQVARVLARLAGEGADMTISGQARAAGTARHIGTARADGRAADLAPIVAEIQANGVTSRRGIAAEMNRRGIPTASGRGKWHADTVRQLLARL
jgi:hypothetical protein